MGVLDNLAHVQVEEEDEDHENPQEDDDRSLGLREDALRSQEEDGALRPPCSQQLPAQTKVHSKKEKYEADIKKMTSAARLALVSLMGKYLRVATRTILGSYHPSNILPSYTPDYSMRFSAGPANSAMDPFARRKLRGSILARASVVSSSERSAATEEEKNNKIVFSKTCTNCDL